MSLHKLPCVKWNFDTAQIRATNWNVQKEKRACTKKQGWWEGVDAAGSRCYLVRTAYRVYDYNITVSGASESGQQWQCQWHQTWTWTWSWSWSWSWTWPWAWPWHGMGRGVPWCRPPVHDGRTPFMSAAPRSCRPLFNRGACFHTRRRSQ